MFRSLLGIVLLFLCASETEAATFNIADGDVAGLKSAINTANANGQADTINLAAGGTYILTAVDNGPVNGLPVIVNDVAGVDITINGNGATIARTTSGGTFYLRAFDITGDVTINDLTIADCTISDSGAGIHNASGTLTLSNCVFNDNLTFASGKGGAIYNDSGTVSVNFCSFTNNSANKGSSPVGPGGGGVYNERGNVTVAGCTFSNNHADRTQDGASDGGALFNKGLIGADGVMTITDCTFTNNTGTFRGGAIANTGTMTVRRSTFSGNTVQDNVTQFGSGGAIANTNGTLTVENCTLGDNSAPDSSGAGGGIYNYSPNTRNASLSVTSSTLNGNSSFNGGGIYTNAPSTTSATTTVRNTILKTGSTGANLAKNGANSAYVTQGFNLSSDNGSGFLTAATDQLNTDPKLDTTGLVNNGGSTHTFALLAGSPAIDKGNSFGLTTDQRGLPRPFDNASITNASGGDGSDIGAYEAAIDQVQSGFTLLVNTAADHNDGICGADCTLREAIARANAVSDGFTITFAANVTGTIALSSISTELSIANSATISGPGARVLAVSGSGGHRVFNVSGGSSAISGLTIRDGAVVPPPGTGQSRMGGGILNSATLTLNDCTLVNNSATGATNSAVGGSGGSGQGGGIYNIGDLTLNRCIFSNTPTSSGNAATGANGTANGSQTGLGGNGGSGQGGAVFNAAGHSLIINNCTFKSNSAMGGAGGNSHFGGNGGNGSGGAIFNQGTMTINSCTVSGNSGSGGAGGTGVPSINNGAAGIGIGGLSAAGGSSNTVTNTISGGNTGNFGGGADVDGAFTSNGYNLIGKNDGAATSFPAGNPNGNNDIVGTSGGAIDPKLGALQNNGGPTDTMALLYGSPALDQGKTLLTTDQRNSPRPVDTVFTNASNGNGADIGAVEMNLLGGPDSDGDGMSDDFEAFFGVSDPNVDTDNDGLTNLDEFKAGTNPLDVLSGLRITAVAKNGNDFIVTFATALAGKSYRLERKDALTDMMWSSINGVSDLTPTSTGSGQITDPNGASVPKHFYHIRLLP